ncbi:hypothetical protein RclHR1_00820014 [Rhizophagus clarus]|uniref:Uncharacterized protein n=1 Tax=Rhizophagus clarus TaxID=94130 RepID=A0A2Z6SMP4_9GLOM|nr:hypothetical protein RclHR1_00820014 [Rhizophagus clarus]
MIISLGNENVIKSEVLFNVISLRRCVADGHPDIHNNFLSIKSTSYFNCVEKLYPFLILNSPNRKKLRKRIYQYELMLFHQESRLKDVRLF